MNTTEAIISRTTQKVLGDIDVPFNVSSPSFDINELLYLASRAPYHYPSHESHHKNLTSVTPWRCYTLNSKTCRSLLSHLKSNNIDAGKIANMLATADALLLVTWLPEPSTDEHQLFEGNIKNMEHIAAASAAIQNILLGATEKEIPNYWSSGGVLREPDMFNLFDIPEQEILLGAVFLFPKNSTSLDVTIKSGAWRNKGKELATWSKSIEIKSSLAS